MLDPVLASFVTGSTPPRAAIAAAGRALLDSLGVTLAGAGHEASRIARDVAAGSGGPGASTVIGCDGTLDLRGAVLANAVAAHVLDFDDTLLPTRMHPSATLVPPLLAVAEARDLPASRIPEALAVGFELEARLAEATYPAFADREWHGTGIYGGVGAAAAVARLVGLPADRTAAALGLAATGGAGSMLVFGSMAKSLNLGRAAADGLQAALLAERGFTCRPVFAPDGGILRSYAAEVDTRRLTQGLGETWAVERDGFKPYPCGVVGHAAIDAVLALRSRHPDAPAVPRALDLEVAPETIRLMGEPDPADGLGAKFSVRFAAAAAWVHGRVTLDTFADAIVRDPEVRAALAVTSVTVDPALAQDAARASVALAGGTRSDAAVEHARGTADHPMTDDDLVAKLRGLVPPAVDGERLLDRLHHIDTIPARELALALRATPGRSLG